MLYIMNTSIIPPPFVGTVIVDEISADEAADMLENLTWVSAVGHKATAEALSKLTGVEIPVNRVQIKVTSRDKILAFQLDKRLAEGQVIETAEELERIGYSLRLLEFF